MNTLMDAAPLRSKVLGGISILCLKLILTVIKEGRAALVVLPSRMKATHLKRVVFLGSLGALVPLMFMTLESLGCILVVPNLLDIKRSANPTKQERFADDVWRSCSAVIVPNYSMSVHVSMLQLCALYYAPFCTFTFHDLVKFQMDKRPRVQIVLVSMATTIALFAFGIKEEGGGFVRPRALQLSNLIFGCWGLVAFLQASNLFARGNVPAWAIEERDKDGLARKDKAVLWLKAVHNRWNAFLFSLMDLMR